MKLRGLLKGFFILGLSILPIYFTNAVNYVENVGDYEDLGSNNNCTINSDLSFNCSESNNVIVGTDMSWYKASSSYFWTNSGLAIYIHYQNYNDYQGLITSFVICGNDNVARCNTQISYEDFLTYASNYELTNWRWYSNSTTPGWAGIDFIFGTTHIYFGPNYTSNGELITYGNYTPYNFGLNGYGLDANYTSATNSPFYEVPTGSHIDNVRDSAQNIYDAYRSKGYSDVLCYGGFELTDYFRTGSSFQGLNAGGGATIFELYNVYSGSKSFVDWYSDWDFTYGFMKDYQEDYEVSQYMGKSKGLFGMIAVQDYFFKGSDFDAGMLKSFCEFSFANDTLIDKTHTPIDIINDTVNENELNKMLGNLGVIRPNTGSALDMIVSGLSGYSDNDFFGLIQSGYDTINSIQHTSGNYPGILPTYIVIGFLGILLLYVLKH